MMKLVLNIKIEAICLLILCCFSCGKGHQENNGIESKSFGYYALCNRACLYLETYLQEFNENITWKAEESVSARDFGLMLFVTSSPDLLKEETYDTSYLDPALRLDSDPFMEEQIQRWFAMNPDERLRQFVWNRIDFEPSQLVKVFEYRSETCGSISIKSSSPLFGEEENGDITEKFMFSHVEYRVPELFLFTEDKEFVGIAQDGMTIAEYLSYKPMVLPWFMLAFSELPPELPVETDLTVEMTLSNGKTLSDTVHVILTE